MPIVALQPPFPWDCRGYREGADCISARRVFDECTTEGAGTVVFVKFNSAVEDG